MGRIQILLVGIFSLLFVIFIVLAVNPTFTVNAPNNNTATPNQWMILNVSANDGDSDNLTVLFFGNNGSSVGLESLLYTIKGLNAGSDVIYNWTAPLINASGNLSNHTVALFHFDNRSAYGENDTQVFDFSRMGNNLSCTSCPTFNESNGKFSGTFSFDGVNDFFTFSDNSFGDYDQGTIEAWIYPFSNTSNNIIFSVKMDNNTDTEYFVFYLSSGFLTVGTKTTGPNFEWLVTGHTGISTNKWHHVALLIPDPNVVEDEGHILYVNGIKQTLSHTSGDGSNQEFFADLSGSTRISTIGAIVLNNTYQDFFNGSIDEFAFYNYSLNDSEVLNHSSLQPGRYHWYVNVSDGNTSNSSSVLTFIVGADWTRSPSDFGSTSGNLSVNFTLGNLTISNNGLQNINISVNVSSDFNDTFFNVSFPINISPGASLNIQVNATSPNSSGSTNIVLNVSATNPDGGVAPNPTELLTSARMIHTSSDPFLEVTLSLPVNGTTLVAGESVNVTLNATVENQGTANANNVTLSFVVPDNGWSNTSGSFDLDIGQLNISNQSTHQITVILLSNATTGTRLLLANITGSFTNGTALSSTFLQSDSATITVTPFVTATSPGSGGGGSSGSSTTSSGGGGGGGGSVQRVETGETIYSTNSFEIVRGREDTIPFVITNLYENAILEDIELEVQGFMSQYITVDPILETNIRIRQETINLELSQLGEIYPFSFSEEEHHSIVLHEINEESLFFTLSSTPREVSLEKDKLQYEDLDKDGQEDVSLLFKGLNEGVVDLEIHKLGSPNLEKLYFLEEREYVLHIEVPPYLRQEAYNLTIKIDAEIIPLNPRLAGFSSKHLTEYRTLVFTVLEKDPSEVRLKLSEAEEAVDEMDASGFPTTRVQELFNKAKEMFNKTDYVSTVQFVEQLIQVKNGAFEASRTIHIVEEDLRSLEERWLEAPETEKALTLAHKAFDRQDFETALQRAKDAQLTYILETRGKINILWLLSHYWWAVLLGSFVLGVLLLLSYKGIAVTIIKQRLINLVKEEHVILSLIEEQQVKLFKEKSISTNIYKNKIKNYQKRLQKIKHLKTILRAKRSHLLNTQKELEELEHEHQTLIESIKKEQIDYLEKGKISKEQFDQAYEIDREQLTIVEEKIQDVKEERQEEQKKKTYSILLPLKRFIGFFEEKIVSVKEKKKKKTNKEKKVEKTTKTLKKDVKVVREPPIEKPVVKKAKKTKVIRKTKPSSIKKSLLSKADNSMNIPDTGTFITQLKAIQEKHHNLIRETSEIINFLEQQPKSKEDGKLNLPSLKKNVEEDQDEE